MRRRMLIVDDEEHLRQVVARALGRRGWQVQGSGSGEEALAAVGREAPDLVLLDLRLPDMDGLAVLSALREREPALPVVVITAFATLQTAIQAMKLGARDYLTKPFDLEELALVAERALEAGRLASQVNFLRHELAKDWELVGESPALAEVRRLVEQVAPADTTVLLTGESGTGKEVVARAIHHLSSRRDGPLITVNCAALPEHLLEDELFGHERGAFTGAVARRAGRFEMADGGTIFLDEVAEIPPHMQAKLLRVLQDHSYQRLGGTATVQADVRVLAATNRDLKAAIRQGYFREDLYYRLSVFNIHLPPLRERREDIVPLAWHFLRRRQGLPRGFTRQALELLRRYDWPGNVRELQNVVERATILCRGEEIDAQHLPAELRGTRPEERPPVLLPPGGISLEEVERELIRQALARTDGNQTRAAELLSLTRSALIYRMQKHGLAGKD